jgi:hypothetical protein
MYLFEQEAVAPEHAPLYAPQFMYLFEQEAVARSLGDADFVVSRLPASRRIQRRLSCES